MLHRLLSPFTEIAYTLLRIVTGLLFAFHGAQKQLGLFATRPAPELGSQMWFGGWIELLAGLLVMLGLFTRYAAFVASGTMAVAYVQFHWDFAFTDRFFPIVNEGEPALMFAFTFLFIACRGGGKLSLDGLFGRGRP